MSGRVVPECVTIPLLPPHGRLVTCGNWMLEHPRRILRFCRGTNDAIKPERLGATGTVPEKTGPEAYAPTRKSAERSESEQAAVTAFEGRYAKFVRRDVAYLRRQRNDVDQPDPSQLLTTSTR